ncbi:hypothetical protein HDU86_003987 [Geranomyces michiganensis]|nr:hypothetical protein HDU86_003987 [Geranomyces michiganensis]
MVGMTGKSKEESTKDKKRSLFKSLFSNKLHHQPQTNNHNGSHAYHSASPASALAAPSSAQPDDGANRPLAPVGNSVNNNAGSQQHQEPRRSSFQVFRPSPPAAEPSSVTSRNDKRGSAMPALGKVSPVAATAAVTANNSHGNVTPPPLRDFSGKKPVLTAEAATEGVSLAIYLEEYRSNAASYPSSPTTPTAHNSRAAPVLRVDSTSNALTGTLRVTNTGKPFKSPRLAVMLFTGQGRTGIPVNDPEAPSAAGLHSRPIARSATYIWKEPVVMETGTNDFAFTLPLSASIPPTLNTFSSVHSNRLDVWHALFVKMRRTELDHVVSRQDLVIHKCPPESVKCTKKKARNKTATGSIAEGLIEFKAEGADMCDIDNPATHVMFQAFRNNTVGNCVLIDSVECQWKERISLREGRGGAVTRLERALHQPLRQVLTPDVADSPLSFAPIFNVPIQPDGEFDSVKITHEVVFTIEYFPTPLSDQMTKELVVVPVRFLASTVEPPTPPIFPAMSSYFPSQPQLAPPPSPSDTTTTTTTTTATTPTTATARNSHDSRSSVSATSNSTDFRTGFYASSGPQLPLPTAQPLPQHRAASPQNFSRTERDDNGVGSGGADSERRSSQNSTRSAGQQYRSEHDFFPAEPDEMTLAVGDVVVIFQSFDDGWASGRNLRTNVEGFFPLNALGEMAWSASEAGAAGLAAPVQSDGRFATCKRQASRLPGATSQRRTRQAAGGASTGIQGAGKGAAARAAAAAAAAAVQGGVTAGGNSDGADLLRNGASSSSSSLTAMDSQYRHSMPVSSSPSQPQARTSMPPMGVPSSSFSSSVPQVHVTVPNEPWSGGAHYYDNHHSSPPAAAAATAAGGSNDNDDESLFIPTHLVHGYNRETGLPTPRFEYEPPHIPPASPPHGGHPNTAPASNPPSSLTSSLSATVGMMVNNNQQNANFLGNHNNNARPMHSEPLTPASPPHNSPSQASQATTAPMMSTTSGSSSASYSAPSSALPSPEANDGGGGRGGSAFSAGAADDGVGMSTLDQINMYALQASQQHEREQQQEQQQQQRQRHLHQSFQLVHQHAHAPHEQFWDPRAHPHMSIFHHRQQQHAPVGPEWQQQSFGGQIQQQPQRHRPTSVYMPPAPPLAASPPVSSSFAARYAGGAPVPADSNATTGDPSSVLAATSASGPFANSSSAATNAAAASQAARLSVDFGAGPVLPPGQVSSVRITSSPPQSLPLAHTQGSRIATTTTAMPMTTYRTVREFRPQDGGEIELRIGDTLMLDESHPSGWCLGLNLNSGQRGYFPATSIALLEELPPPPLQHPPMPSPPTSSSHASYYPPSHPSFPVSSASLDPSRVSTAYIQPPTSTTVSSAAEAALPEIQQQYVPGAKPSAESIGVLLRVLDEEMLAGLVDPQSYVESRRRLLTAQQQQQQQQQPR